MKFWREVLKVVYPASKWNYDALLFSFPKCGRTWLTLQIGRVICKHFGLDVANPLEMRELKALRPEIPSILITHEDQPHRKRPHELQTSKRKFAGKRIVFLVRDPRDVLVSYYFEKSKREQDRKFWWFQKKRRETHTPFKGTISEFLNFDIGGFDTILRYYNIWAENRNVPAQFLVVKYEDMKAEPNRILRQVLDFIGLNYITDAEISDAVEFSKFENMQKIEAKKAINSAKLTPGDEKDKESFKVRRGKSGGYVDYFTPEEVAGLNRKMAETLTDFYGYEPNVKKPAPAPTT